MGVNVVKLKDVVDVLNGYAFKSSKYIKSGHRVMRITNVQKGILVDDDPKYYEQSNDLDKYELRVGDILISLTGNVGRVGLVNESILPAYLNQRVGCLRIKSDKIYNGYLFHLLNNDSFEDSCIRNSNGIAQLNMSTEWLKDVEINLPSLEEQKKIARILDKADEIRTKKRLANDKLDEFLKSTFISMFGDPVKNDKDWHSSKVGEFASVTKLAGFEYTKYIHYQDSGDVIMVKGLNVKNRKLVLRELSYIDSKVSNQLKRSQLHKNDIVMTYVGINIGDVALIDDKNKYHLAPNVAKISINDFGIVNPVFLVVLLDYSRIKFASKATNTAKQALNMERIRNIDVILPPYNMQEKFAKIVEHVEAQKQKNELVIEQMNNLFNSLSQRAFKGEL